MAEDIVSAGSDSPRVVLEAHGPGCGRGRRAGVEGHRRRGRRAPDHGDGRELHARSEPEGRYALAWRRDQELYGRHQLCDASDAAGDCAHTARQPSAGRVRDPDHRRAAAGGRRQWQPRLERRGRQHRHPGAGRGRRSPHAAVVDAARVPARGEGWRRGVQGRDDRRAQADAPHLHGAREAPHERAAERSASAREDRDLGGQPGARRHARRDQLLRLQAVRERDVPDPHRAEAGWARDARSDGLRGRGERRRRHHGAGERRDGRAASGEGRGAEAGRWRLVRDWRLTSQRGRRVQGPHRRDRGPAERSPVDRPSSTK